jgi:hypothetical protein
MLRGPQPSRVREGISHPMRLSKARQLLGIVLPYENGLPPQGGAGGGREPAA